MGYQTGQISPPPYHQDNSGHPSDITTPINYTPEMFGAPPGSQIVTSSVSQQLSMCRGSANVQNLTITPDAISFDVWTQAADTGILGHHSGCITVTTSFSWWDYTADEETIKGYVPSEEDALRRFIRERRPSQEGGPSQG